MSQAPLHGKDAAEVGTGGVVWVAVRGTAERERLFESWTHTGNLMSKWYSATLAVDTYGVGNTKVSLKS